MPTVSEQGCHSEAVNASQIGEFEIQAAKTRARIMVRDFGVPQRDEEDYAQEILLRLIQNRTLEKFDPERQSKQAFVRVCVKHLSFTVMNLKRYSRKTLLGYEESLNETPATSECQAYRVDLKLDVEQALNRLTGRDRDIAELAKIRNQKEIAESLGLCRSGVHDSFQRLRLGLALSLAGWVDELKTPTDEDFYSIDYRPISEVAEFVDLSAGQVRNLITSEQLYGEKDGKSYAVSTQSVRQYLDRKETEAKEAFERNYQLAEEKQLRKEWRTRSMTPEEFFSKNEQPLIYTARFLGISRSTAMERCKSGDLESRRDENGYFLVQTRSVDVFRAKSARAGR